MAEEKDKKEQAEDSKKSEPAKEEKKAKKDTKAKKTKAEPVAEDTKKEVKKPAAKKKTEKKEEPAKASDEKQAVKKEAKKDSSKAKKEKADDKKVKADAKKADSKKKEDKKEKKSKPKTEKSDYVPRLKTRYREEIMPALKKKFNYKNVMEIPKITKITMNIGMGDAIQNKNLLDIVVDDLQVISGQKAVITKAKKSVSNFKLREGYAIGCRVTLRRERMYEFLDRFISLAIPRIRDFRGISDKSFDGFGNYNLGIKEQIIFPEIDYDKIEIIHGLDINFVTTAKTDEECYELLKAFGMPFVEREEQAAEAESA